MSFLTLYLLTYFSTFSLFEDELLLKNCRGKGKGEQLAPRAKGGSAIYHVGYIGRAGRRKRVSDRGGPIHEAFHRQRAWPLTGGGRGRGHAAKTKKKKKKFRKG